MANEEHVTRLRQNVAGWNAWRQAHADLVPDLRGAGLSGANLSEADLRGAVLAGADLREAVLIQADLSGAILSNADLSGAILSNADLSGANLPGASLERAFLRGTILEAANLTGANLTGANLTEANLTEANLTGANLTGANLTGANLTGANLTGADLTGADLTGADLHESQLEGADLTSAVLSYAILADVDLQGVQGLTTVVHFGPSSVGIDTLYRSRGNIPEAFLRGCGVPDTLIEYLPSLVGAEEVIKYYSCFISYSHQDESFAQRLHSRLRDKHLRVWYAPEDMQGGKKLYDQIDAAIILHDKLLLVLSAQSMQSAWVTTEIRRARKAERTTGKRKLFPIRLVDFTTLRDWELFDADSGTDLAVAVREYFIPDFSTWKDHDTFEAAFARLLRDLQAAEQAA